MKQITNKLINITALIKKHLSFDANQNVDQRKEFSHFIESNKSSNIIDATLSCNSSDRASNSLKAFSSNIVLSQTFSLKTQSQSKITSQFSKLQPQGANP